jgi:hypothetical protein
MITSTLIQDVYSPLYSGNTIHGIRGGIIFGYASSKWAHGIKIMLSRINGSLTERFYSNPNISVYYNRGKLIQ